VANIIKFLKLKERRKKNYENALLFLHLLNKAIRIEVIYNNCVVGRLALTKDGLCAFEYAIE
jgi:hypothetical protein